MTGAAAGGCGESACLGLLFVVVNASVGWQITVVAQAAARRVRVAAAKPPYAINPPSASCWASCCSSTRHLSARACVTVRHRTMFVYYGYLPPLSTRIARAKR
jgi:hypothetical protein